MSKLSVKLAVLCTVALGGAVALPQSGEASSLAALSGARSGLSTGSTIVRVDSPYAYRPRARTVYRARPRRALRARPRTVYRARPRVVYRNVYRTRVVYRDRVVAPPVVAAPVVAPVVYDPPVFDAPIGYYEDAPVYSSYAVAPIVAPPAPVYSSYGVAPVVVPAAPVYSSYRVVRRLPRVYSSYAVAPVSPVYRRDRTRAPRGVYSSYPRGPYGVSGGVYYTFGLGYGDARLRGTSRRRALFYSQ